MAEPKAGDIIAVWFSCGAASAVAAKKTIEKYGDKCIIRVLNTPIKEEHEDNQRFRADVQKWLGVEIETVINPDYPNSSAVEVWDKRKYMSGVEGAPCTGLLKKAARRKWMGVNRSDWHVLGFTADEADRYNDLQKTELPNLLNVLGDLKITKGDCFIYLTDAGLKLPVMYDEGYPNANCKGCVKASSPTYWNHVRRVDPDVFAARAEQSRRLGVKLVRVHPMKLRFCHQRDDGYWIDDRTNEVLTYIDGKGRKRTKDVRLFLDELPPDIVGEPMKDMNFECGIFCGLKGHV